MAIIPKSKGDPTECSSARGVWVADVLAKTYHQGVRRAAERPLVDYALPTQCGGIAGCATDIAHLSARLFMSWARHNGISAAILFIDVRAAFDSMSRCETFPMHGAATSSQPAVADAGVDPYCQHLLADLHVGTWFRVQHAVGQVCTSKGCKQGDPTDDLAFVFMMTKLLVRLKARL